MYNELNGLPAAVIMAGSIIKDTAIVLVIYIAGRIILKIAINKIVEFSKKSARKIDMGQEKRAETLGSVMLSIGNFVLMLLCALMILGAFGINLAPILAGLGIGGLALGFGAQSLVKDFVSGLLILLENQYAVGDTIKIGAVEGRVSKITLRSTIIEDKDGNINFIPNGSISAVQNIINSQKPEAAETPKKQKK
jgi:small conductance mechanosensitive channel